MEVKKTRAGATAELVRPGDRLAAETVLCFAAMDARNKLYFGDNLRILREHVPDASVDLIYLDPPFNSNANYNVLFKENVAQGPRSGPAAFQLISAAQITAFDNTRERMSFAPHPRAPRSARSLLILP